MYLLIGCVYGFMLCYTPFYNLPQRDDLHKSPAVSHAKFRAIRAAYFLCLLIGVAMSFLFSWHVYLLLNGLTTIDYFQRRRPQRRQRMLRNFERVFGHHPVHWTLALLPSRRPPPLNSDEFIISSIESTMV